MFLFDFSVLKTYAQEHWDILLGLALGYIGVILPVLKFLQDKRSEERSRRFEHYHSLLDQLLGAQSTAKLHRQIAIIFELRNFNRYHEVSKRILADLKLRWQPTFANNPALEEEINLSLRYLHSSKFRRFLIDRFNWW